jgi:predicted lipoprotein with Yx(FWY)xxD motif
LTINIGSNAELGSFLVDGNGMTLYWTTLDSVGQSNVTGTTLANWPVFYVTNVVVPSSLNASDFGSITRADGSMQTTFEGWPLYYYVKDVTPGDTLGQGIKGVWSVVNPTASGPMPVPTTTATTSSAPTISGGD